MSTSLEPHRIEIKVRGYHLDLYGHVNNARYLEFLEEARWALTEEQGHLDYFARTGLAFAVVNININYRRAALMGETLSIESAMRKIGRRSAVVHQVIKLAGTETRIADADVTFVIFDAQLGGAVALEGKLRGLFEALPHWPNLP